MRTVVPSSAAPIANESESCRAIHSPMPADACSKGVDSQVGDLFPAHDGSHESRFAPRDTTTALRSKWLRWGRERKDSLMETSEQLPHGAVEAADLAELVRRHGPFLSTG